jgi:hypothetical protein
LGGGGEGVNVPYSLTGGTVSCYEYSKFWVVGNWGHAMVPTASRWSIIGRVRVRFQARPCAIGGEKITPLKQVSVQAPGVFLVSIIQTMLHTPYVFTRMLATDGVVKQHKWAKPNNFFIYEYLHKF